MDIQTEMVEFPSNGGTTPGYLAQPVQVGNYPGIVAIQEWWGLVPHIEDVVERLAREGFITLAPDLYHGQKADEPDEARKLAMDLDRERAVREIVAAAHYLQSLGQVSPKKIGVVGWCMGGSLTLATAAVNPDIGAAVAFYGAPRDLQMLRTIQSPVLGLFAEHDHGITPEMVQTIGQILQEQGVVHETHLYPGTQHAFFNDTRPHIYNAEAAKDAWERTLAWFRQYLK
jgi:carboxymethylenebutenolidase